jgi:large subunit ribosomal protein L32e
MAKKDILQVKATIKSKRPLFRRASAVHTLRVSRTGYRRPKGLHNKIKDNRKGHATTIKSGYGYPRDTRGCNAQGKEIVLIRTLDELKNYKPSEIAVILDASLGAKKKEVIVAYMLEHKYVSQTVYDLVSLHKKLQESKKTATQESAKMRELRAKNKENALKLKQGKKSDSKAESKDEAKPAPAKDASDAPKDAEAAQKREHDKLLIKN